MLGIDNGIKADEVTGKMETGDLLITFFGDGVALDGPERIAYSDFSSSPALNSAGLSG